VQHCVLWPYGYKDGVCEVRDLLKSQYFVFYVLGFAEHCGP